MPVRHYLLFAILSISMTAAAPAQKVQATWWYPLGNAEGTRRHFYLESDPAFAPTQKDTDLVIKWRTPMLRNSPVTLVGGIRRPVGDSIQQVVGLIENTDQLLILTHRGRVNDLVSIKPLAFSPNEQVKLTLTGLFNSRATSPEPIDAPNLIGIGVEKRQRETQNGTPSVLFGMALGTFNDTILRPRRKFVIDELPNDPRLDNQSAAIYPVAIYDGGAFIAVSQNGYAGTDSVRNSFRRYTFSPGSSNTETALDWIYPIAPKSYPQHPAIARDSRTLDWYFALSTTAYAAGNRTITPGSPTLGVPTNTDSAYSINISENGVHEGTTRVPEPPSPALRVAEARSYFFTLYEAQGAERGETYRLITEEHGPTAPGDPRIVLKRAFEKDAATYGDTTFADMSQKDLGLTVVAADIDGKGEDRSVPDDGRLFYRNNYGDEVIVAFRDPNGADLPTNFIYALRRSEYDKVGELYDLQRFITYQFSGRLMAAGDLVNDTVQRGSSLARRTFKQELVIANGPEVRVLQLRDYDDPVFNRFGSDIKTFFDVVWIDTLDSRVVSVAIADLEGDGENDLIVNTEQSTYAIGRRDPDPLGSVKPDSTEYCRGESVTIAWNRRVGGGQNGLKALLLKSDNKTEPLSDIPPKSSPTDPHNPGTGPDTFTIPTAGLAPGSYRVILRDPLVDAIADTSDLFSVNQPVFTAFAVDTGAAPQFGQDIVITARVHCSRDLVLRRSIDGGAWETLPVPVTMINDSAVARTRVPCPADLDCGAGIGVNVRFQFADRNNYGESEIGTFEIPVRGRPVRLTPDSTSRSRSRAVSWSGDDFACGNLEVLLSLDGGSTWTQVEPSVPVAAGEYAFEIPEELFGRLKVRLCCADASATCEFGVSSTFEIPKSSVGNYVAPNPFDPESQGTNGGDGAVIVYGLKEPGTVTITIFDASRAVVARPLEGAEQNTGRHRVTWNGRNSRNDIVASGTYICIIESSSGEQIVLPIIVLRH